MARKTDIPRVQNPPSGDGHHVTSRYMTATELAERDARQKSYDDMLARQQAYENRVVRQPRQQDQDAVGCVFAKSCNLPDGVINHENPAGFILVEKLADYGEFSLLGGRERDTAGNIRLQRMGGGPLPGSLGTLLLSGAAATNSGTTIAAGAGVMTAGVAAGALAGIVALLWPSNLGDSSLYTEEQLKSLKEGRTRVRLHLEQQADGSLKGYGYNTQKRSDWEMIPVVQFVAQGLQQVADFGNGATLIWTPAVDPTSTSGIPPLEGAPQAPPIWIYPPTPTADSIIVNPVYPPEYKDFILVFPADSGVQPLYVVISRPALGGDIKYHRPPLSLPAYPDAFPVKPKSGVQGGGSKRSRWKDRKGRIYEWDSKTGAIEIYNKQGKHLGEFNHETGEQIDPATPGRFTNK
ncbi:hypothetical protein QF019_004544 [Pseudomonas frederiksbergensis]|uniref:S-type pyocin domain-containing protein n=1 Tax=Pseudomonas frederiksbergensis TaxID=104087 RepID=UPI003D1BBCE0